MPFRKPQKIHLIDKGELLIRPVEPTRKPDAWFRSEKHLAWIRTQPSAATGESMGIEACHVRIGSDGASGMKPSDFYALPLTAYEHRKQHSIGEHSFWSQYGVFDPIALALTYAMRSPCERTRKAATRVASGLPWCMDEAA